MNTTGIELGVVVRTWFGPIGIVCAKGEQPAKDWIDDQHNSEEIRKLGRTEWWRVLLFDGGAILSPGPLLEHLREASYDDFLAAIDKANIPARKHLAKLFPGYLDRVLAERQNREAQD